MGKNMKLGCCFIAAAFMILAAGCGGSSSDTSGTGGITITSTVSMPTGTASISARPGKTVTEAPSEGVEVRLEDLSGTLIATGTTDANGISSITATEAQVRDGFRLVANSILRDLYIPESADLTAGTISRTVNAESTYSFAVENYICGNNLATGNATFAMNDIFNAANGLVNNESPQIGYVIGDFEGGLMIVADLLQGGHDAGTIFSAALTSGNSTDIENIIGTTIPNTSLAVSDAVTGNASGHSLLRDALFTRDPTIAPVETIKADTLAAGNTFNIAVLTAPVEYQIRANIANFTAESFRAFAENTVGLANAAVFTNNGVAKALALQFQYGGFTDTANAPIAVGALYATTGASFDSTAFDPTTAALAAYNTASYYVNNGGILLPANDFASAMSTALGNADYRSSMAFGGTPELDKFVGAFISNSAAWNAEAAQTAAATLGGASSAVCTSSSNCITGLSCIGSVCTASSAVFGGACSSAADCDATTSCQGSFFAGGNGICMMTATMSSHANVYSTEGAAPAPPPPMTSGGQGSTCGTSIGTSCSAGYTCTDPVSGICVGPCYPRGYGMPCTANCDCSSGSCASGHCTSPGTGTKTTGEPCGMSMECVSGSCVGWLCAAPGGGSGTANGEICTTNAECQSTRCCTSGYTCGATCGAGSHCTDNSYCTSSICNMMVSPFICFM